MDTMFATSSGQPPAAIAIVRVSGPQAFATATALAGTLPPVRAARVRALRRPETGELLDRALVLVFEGPRTATGEDVVEFHVHGGRAVVAAVEAALAARPGLRRADPGEFTRRALANGVIDLTAAEGLGDLLAAETEGQRRAALQVAEGGLRALVDGWTDELIAVAARIEAMLDFADEDDVATESLAMLDGELATLGSQIAALLAEPPVERLQDGVSVVLAGPPNSGKSTLLNRLAGRDVAIVSPISGTTRDRIEVPVVRNGIAYLLTDTAGLAAASDDPIERIGIARAQAAVAAADIVLWFGDDAPVGDALWLYPRADQPERRGGGDGRIVVSALTGDGMPSLWARIEARATMLLPRNDRLSTNRRQRDALSECLAALVEARATHDPLIVAEDVRIALRALDRVTGRAGVEHILDAIFSRFCLGK